MLKKVLKLLTKRERKRLYLLFVVMVVSAVIEVAGIASIMPFLSLITSPDLIQDNAILNRIYTDLSFESTNRFLIFTGVMVLIILVVSNLLVFLTNWGLARFSWMRNHSIARRLLRSYLSQPYSFFLNQNTSILGKNILSEVQIVVKGVIVPLLEIFSRGIVAVFIFIMLIVVEPVLALSSIIILGGAYILTYRIIKQRLNIKGKKRYKTNTERFKAVSEAFGDIKQLKLIGCENIFIKRFSKPSDEYAKHNASAQIIGHIPRYIIEVIAFGGIIIIVLYFLVTRKGLEDFLPIIGLYAFSTYRLLPSLQLIFTGIATARYNNPGLDSLYNEMYSFKERVVHPSLDKKKVEPLSFCKILELKSITYVYPGTYKPVIKDLNIKIDVNTSIAFAGATGAGKTTIANIILGLLRPDSGKMIVDGVEITDENLSSWQRNLGYIPQDIYLQHDTVIKNITFGIPYDKVDMDSVIKSAKIANIHDFITEELPDKYNTIVGERGVRLSGGQRQRIGIARALYHDPAVLVLDEATSALDGATEQEVFKAIENIAKTKTLIIIAHRLTTIQDCDVIYVMENGKIVGTGRYDKLIKTNRVFKKIAKVQL
jgi:ABC-type multidrug transport system fused ATPase/permease subunit